jgi:hypothetical protein
MWKICPEQAAWQPLLRQLAQTMELSYFSQEYTLVRVRTESNCADVLDKSRVTPDLK